jgi:acetolactate synthase-1/2/3 large subunit
MVIGYQKAICFDKNGECLMKVAELFVKCLENEGVRYVFGVPGEENEDLLFALADSTINFVPTRHEQGAAFMADVWGRLTGKAGVCLSTLGPGATNLITGVADAQLDKSPVVAITGQANLERLHQESHQCLDIVNMFKPITKWNTAISDPDIVPEVIRKAFKSAEMEKPGAAHIELSEDVAKLQTSSQPIKVKKIRRPSPDRKALTQMVDLIKNAHKPMIIAGNGAIRKLAFKYLRRMIDLFHIPIVHTFMAKGAVSYKCSDSLLSIGLGLRDYVMEAIDQADLIIAIGYDIAEYAPEKWNPRNDKRIIHIDFSPAEVYTHYQPEVEVIGDISSTLWQLTKELNPQECHFDTSWYEPFRKRILADIQSYDLHENDSLTIPGAINIIHSIMKHDNDLLISDVGSHKMWIARNYLTCYPNSCIISNGLASMGIALPGAIAACLVNPHRRVVAAMGDGGFLMNSQELETAKRLNVNFTVIIFNDNDYGLISWKQQMHRGRSTSTKINNPDFKKYAESFGIKGYHPQTVIELKEDLDQAINSPELCVVEITVNSKVNFDLFNKLQKYFGQKKEREAAAVWA